MLNKVTVTIKRPSLDGEVSVTVSGEAYADKDVTDIRDLACLTSDSVVENENLRINRGGYS